MSFDRFATAMIAIGAGLGLAAASAVPTGQRSPEKAYPPAHAADYPEIAAVTYESYSIAQAPLMRRPQMKLAAWEAPWSQDTVYPDTPVPDQVDPDFEPDPQIVEDDSDAGPIADDPVKLQRAAFESEDEPMVEAQPAKPVRITLSVLP